MLPAPSPIDFDAIINRGHALCRGIALRELGVSPLYIVRQSAIATEFGAGKGCSAYTTPSLDLYLADQIHDYQGRGPCMVINDLEETVLGTIIHELAHILDRPALFEDRPNIEPAKLKFESLVLADAITRPKPTVQVPPWYGHGASFIRIALHLRHRAWQHGVHLLANELCGGSRYGLSPRTAYKGTLGDEPRRLAHLTFKQIAAIEPPAAFTNLWLEDQGTALDRDQATARIEQPAPVGRSHSSTEHTQV
jgi:hypothetical protein